jgi:hypothetical protein
MPTTNQEENNIEEEDMLNNTPLNNQEFEQEIYKEKQFEIVILYLKRLEVKDKPSVKNIKNIFE